MKKNSPDIWPKPTISRPCVSEPAYPPILESDLDENDTSIGSDSVFSPGGSSRGSWSIFPGSENNTFRSVMTSSVLKSTDLSTDGTMFSFDSENMEENVRAGSTSNSEKDEIKIPEFNIDLNDEKSNRISPKPKSRETGLGVECPLPKNSHYKKDSPDSGLTPVKKTKSQKPREDRRMEPFEDNEIIFKISKFNYVGLWKWDVDCDICAICRVVICDPCLTVRLNIIFVVDY